MSDLTRYLVALGFMRQRGLIVCQCSLQKACDVLTAVSGRNVFVLTEQAVDTIADCANVRLFANAQLRTQLLGAECDVLLVDLRSGLAPDALALASGALVGGGICVLCLDSSWQSWPQAACADYQRMLPYPHQVSGASFRFLQHLKRTLELLIGSGQTMLLDDLAQLSSKCAGEYIQRERAVQQLANDFAASRGQAEIVATLAEHCGLALLTGPRGAGKSSCLGLLAAAMQRRQRKVYLLTTAKGGRHAISKALAAAGGQPLEELSLTSLLSQPTHAPNTQQNLAVAGIDPRSVLLIDESATISAAIVEQLIARFPTVVMASTTEGYEGSGQALAVKLVQRWQQRADFIHKTLSHSLRFSAPDPVAALLQRGLLIDAEPVAELSAAQAWQWRLVSQTELFNDEDLLARVYGLLRQAHYRTTPDDLRVLLDGVNTHCALLEAGSDIACVCLWVIEGGLDCNISEAIAAGARRPRGHLLPQSLAVHLDRPEFLRIKVARVMRIAVHGACRRQGLASRCLAELEHYLQQQGVAWLGSSFSASEEALGFWLSQRYQLLRVGERRHPASGEYAALVLKQLL